MRPFLLTVLALFCTVGCTHSEPVVHGVLFRDTKLTEEGGYDCEWVVDMRYEQDSDPFVHRFKIEAEWAGEQDGDTRRITVTETPGCTDVTTFGTASFSTDIEFDHDLIAPEAYNPAHTRYEMVNGVATEYIVYRGTARMQAAGSQRTVPITIKLRADGQYNFWFGNTEPTDSGRFTWQRVTSR